MSNAILIRPFIRFFFLLYHLCVFVATVKINFQKYLSMMNIIEHSSDFLGGRRSILVETTEHHGGAF